MRHVLVDHAREKRAEKRGGRNWERVTLSAVDGGDGQRGVDVLELDDALKELGRLRKESEELVELRFFGGLSEQEAADALGISRSDATRRWRLARAWLRNQLEPEA